MTFNRTHFPSWRVSALGLLALSATALSGCLDRPVAQTKPETNNVFVKQNPSGGIDKIDILFMIDNSLSMGDKQEVLKAAVPQLLRRLTNPDCVDPTGVQAAVEMNDPNTACTGDLQREFSPVKDIHIGIVTSSLGAFGGDSCPTDGPQNAPQNDHAWLLGALPRNSGLGLQPFLSWTTEDAQNYGNQINAKITEFGNFVGATTELGCGNEMILEGWYRFLIDPKPPVDVTMTGQQANVRGAPDGTILQLRQAFLRPDSLVAVFMLADENDCSMRDDTYSWVAMTASGGFRMWRGSSVCESNPNDPCCYSCMFGAPNGCAGKDPSCVQAGDTGKLTADKDDVNVRCRAMKKRFGYDFLFPASRYVNALTKTKICPDQTFGDLDCDCTVAKQLGVGCNPGQPVDNPLYVNLNPSVIPTGPERTGADAVFLAGVVGVPWQDLVMDRDAPLAYMRASELTQQGRWDLFAPKLTEDYSQAQLRDPLMLESFGPRSGTHPLTQEAVAPPEAGVMANSINGHEWYTSNKDVQYACIFSLDVQLTANQTSAVRTCDLQTECGTDDGSDNYRVCARRFDGCSCTLSSATATAKSPLDPTISMTPLCQQANGSYGNQQRYAKAYPGLRELQVLRGFHENTQNSDNAIVGSICPKDLSYANRTTAGYGYNPAVKALVDRLKEKLGGTCLPRKLTIDPQTGKVPCAIVEAISSPQKDWCNCAANQRLAVSSQLQGAIMNALEREKLCGANLAPCSNFCLCQLQELNDDACLNQPNREKNADAPGFCYVDPSQNHGSSEIVAACQGSEQDKRMIRIVGTGSGYTAAPAPGKVYIACSGSAYEPPTQ